MINHVKDILLVEDNPTICKVHTYFLRKLGFTVKTIARGKPALSALIRQPYHAMLLDLDLPDMQGETILSLFRDYEKTHGLAYLPIIVTTATTDTHRIQACQAQGADVCLIKPISFKTFQKTLLQLGVITPSLIKTDIPQEVLCYE